MALADLAWDWGNPRKAWPISRRPIEDPKVKRIFGGLLLFEPNCPDDPLTAFGEARTRPFTRHEPAWLQEALDELQNLDQESSECDWELTSPLAKENAERLLRALAYRVTLAPSVHPTADREVAIFFRNQSTGYGVLIACDSDGHAACFAHISGRNRRARYDDANDLPDGFVVEELDRLEST
jgi:hypothetical protein